MIEIQHRFSKTTLCSFEVETVREAAERGKANLRGANLRGANLIEANLYEANLYEANLIGANLYGANLIGANLYGADLDGEKLTKTPLTVSNLTYSCLISDNYMRLGCKRFTHEEWAAFDNVQIANMHSAALEFWKKWKEPLLAMCAAHKAATISNNI